MDHGLHSDSVNLTNRPDSAKFNKINKETKISGGFAPSETQAPRLLGSKCCKSLAYYQTDADHYTCYCDSEP
jgi:hypothetical protein